jgi:hypothetical protein
MHVLSYFFIRIQVILLALWIVYIRQLYATIMPVVKMHICGLSVVAAEILKKIVRKLWVFHSLYKVST